MEEMTKTAGASALSPARRRTCVALLVVLGFSLGCSEFAVIGVEQEIADAYGVTLAEAGQLISFFAMTYAFLTPLLTLATGRFKRFHLVVAYSAVFCVANLVQSLAPTFGILLVSRVLIGAVSGTFLGVGITFVPELVDPKRTSAMISVVYAAFSVAMVVATSVGKALAALSDWHIIMWAALALALVTCAALIALLPREGATDEPATAGEQVRLLFEPQVMTGIAIFVFGVGSIYVFYGYVTPYLETVLGMSPLAASATLMAYGAGTFASNLLSGWVDSRFGIRALCVTFPMLSVVLLTLWLAGSSQPLGLACVMAISLLMYIASVPCISMFMSTAMRKHPKALTLASSLEATAFNIGIAFGTAVGGVIVSDLGLANVGAVGAVFALVALGLVLVTIPLERRSRAKA